MPYSLTAVIFLQYKLHLHHSATHRASYYGRKYPLRNKETYGKGGGGEMTPLPPLYVHTSYGKEFSDILTRGFCCLLIKKFLPAFLKAG